MGTTNRKPSSTQDGLAKQREIAFCTLHADKDQAATAVSLLEDLDGMDAVERISPALIRVRYQINHVCLADIEDLLADRGFHLDNALIHRMRRALVHYMEETQRMNMGCGSGESNCTTKVFINRYRKRDHGCQDERPRHWRRYL
jgi:hypothetical protein